MIQEYCLISKLLKIQSGLLYHTNFTVFQI